MRYEENYRNFAKRLRKSGVALILPIVLFGLSCSTPKIATSETTTVTNISETIRDTTIALPADSAMYRAWLECDSLGNVLMRELATKNGERTHIDVKLTPDKATPQLPVYKPPDGSVRNKGFVLDITAISDSLRHEIEIRDKIIETIKSQKETVIVEVDKSYPWYAKMLMWLGGAFILLVLIAVYKQIKR